MASRSRITFLAAASVIAAAAAPGSAAAHPDLVPLLNNPMNAAVGVQNTGTTAAGASHLTINCTAFGQVDGGCPDAPGMAAYVDPAYPNRAVIDVPALEPGESFNHDLSFWNAIPWVPGTFIFDAEVDPGNEVAELNEADNTTQSSYTEQPGIGVAPPAPLPFAAQPASPPPPGPQPSKLDSRNIFQLKASRSTTTPPQRPAGARQMKLKQPAQPKRPRLPGN
ncbi:MAG: CARDB domain-containing protein [Kiloniellaceae bacterium]